MGKKKEKITYIDDGSTIADMSGLGSGTGLTGNGYSRPRASFKEQWATYWNAVKMMFLPMLTVVGGILILYVIVYFLFTVM